MLHKQKVIIGYIKPQWTDLRILADVMEIRGYQILTCESEVPLPLLSLSIVPMFLSIIYNLDTRLKFRVNKLRKLPNLHFHRDLNRTVRNFQSMKSPVELNSLLSKLICYITRFAISPDQMRHWTTCTQSFSG